MPIILDPKRRTFHLQGQAFSYVISCEMDDYPHHLYWGQKLDSVPCNMIDRVNYRRAAQLEGVTPDDPHYSREFYHYECPTYGTSDFRIPALEIEDLKTGRDTLDLHYVSHQITRGKENAPGLPCARGSEEDVETLALTLFDSLLNIEVTLFYHLFEKADLLVRRMEVKNAGEGEYRILQAMSASLEFEDGEFDLMTPGGQQLREFEMTLRPLTSGLTQTDSTRGISSHNHKPMGLLLRPGTDEDQGEVYALSLIYSGNFVQRFEKDAFGAVRAQTGINPFQFSWKLSPGEVFCTPEAVLAYSCEGVNGVSRHLHTLVRESILPRRPLPPVLLNTWEACYFDVNQPRLEEIAGLCAGCGIELLVLDDGWFGHRNDATSSLGDWYVNREKFPQGLKGLADSVQALGLKLGIWVEPEMVSPDSDLYRAHPDWCIHVEGRNRTLWRNQLVLDFANEDVVEYIIGCLDRILETGYFSYVKWDNNRRLTELGSPSLPPERQKEFSHRHMLGVYRVLETITKKYPQVLFENCASGGGRFDYGMYNYFTQGWISDDTDPVCRLSIQNAGSVFFPPEVTTAHVSASPNHQTGRATPLSFRRDTALLFNFGFELNPAAMTEEELQEMKAAAEDWKGLRNMVMNGRFVRLTKKLLPDSWYGWQVIHENRVAAVVLRPFCRPEPAFWQLKLKSLEKDGLYRLEGTEQVYSGAQLMGYGLQLPWRNGDFYSQVFLFEKLR